MKQPDLSASTYSRIQFATIEQQKIHGHKRHSEYIVFHNGMDVTPKPISPFRYHRASERTMQLVDENAEKIYENQQNSQFQTSELKFGGDTTGGVTRMQSTMQSLGTNIDDFLDVTESDDLMTKGTVSEMSFFLTPLPELDSMPEFITITLFETETMILFELTSATVEKDTPEGAETETDNRDYEYITQGKGKNRKLMDAEVQTPPTLMKTRETEARWLKSENHHTFASVWDMFDTFVEEEQHEGEKEYPLNAVRSKSSRGSTINLELPEEDKQMIKLMKNERFQEAMCVMQRILSNNVFNEQQKRYRGMSDPDPFRENIEFNYTLNLLWTWDNDETQGRCVTAISTNPSNNDIVAVGYGKFFYDDEATGLVLLWNMKNCGQPERRYEFETPVTSLCFSKQNPNLLAVGFYDGYVKVLEVSSRTIHVMGACDKYGSGLFEPIWQVTWYTDQDYYFGQEFLVATCQDGSISRFQLTMKTITMPYSRMMRFTNAEGKLKGIEALRKCPTQTIPLSRHQPALVYAQHPASANIYLVGTAEGVIHVCSKNYYHQHLDLFLAHDSPIYGIEFSPFCNRLFLTCGDDWVMRVWADTIPEPLFEIKKRMAGVQGVVWSPSHSTIVASICAHEIFIWDFQRKTYDSQSTTVNPNKARNTVVKFTEDGRCLMVGDLEGSVHVFCLDDMPFQAFFQENLLTQSIKRALFTRPDVLSRIEKLGKLHLDEKI